MIPAPLLQSTDPASALGEPDPDGIYRIDETDSVLTLARSLYAADRLPVYGSIFANLQTAGRGQYGRAWESARGNLHAGVRLPLEGVYATRASAAPTAALTAEALRSIGFPVLMKWPNDIICLSPNGPAKVGGILLEQTDGLLTAGIGLNVNWSPEVSALREGAALPPGRLVPRGGAAMDPYELWRRILRHLREADPVRLTASWRALAQAHLLWLGSDVAVESAEGAMTEADSLVSLPTESSSSRHRLARQSPSTAAVSSKRRLRRMPQPRHREIECPGAGDALNAPAPGGMNSSKGIQKSRKLDPQKSSA